MRIDRELSGVRPQRSPAIVVAILALVAAVAGTALADPVATTSKVTKKKVRKIADRRIAKAAPTLSVANAQNAANADTVDGLHATDLQTSSGFGQRDTDLSLTATDQDVVATNVTNATGARVIAVASVNLDSDGGDDDRAVCVIRIAGVDSTSYLHELPDAGSDQSTTALTFARVLGAGTHAVALRCRAATGTVEVEDAGLSAWAVGS